MCLATCALSSQAPTRQLERRERPRKNPRDPRSSWVVPHRFEVFQPPRLHAPLAPSGWPIAIAPPLTLVFARSAPVSWAQALATGDTDVQPSGDGVGGFTACVHAPGRPVTDNSVTRDDLPPRWQVQADSERVMVRDRHVRRGPARWRNVDASTGRRDSRG
jgi:hypothetical protein